MTFLLLVIWYEFRFVMIVSDVPLSLRYQQTFYDKLSLTNNFCSCRLAYVAARGERGWGGEGSGGEGGDNITNVFVFVICSCTDKQGKSFATENLLFRSFHMISFAKCWIYDILTAIMHNWPCGSKFFGRSWIFVLRDWSNKLIDLVYKHVFFHLNSLENQIFVKFCLLTRNFSIFQKDKQEKM